MTVQSMIPQPAELLVNLTQLAISATDIPSAVHPILETFVTNTASVGAAYFQLTGGVFLVRATEGVMPSGPPMEAILAHGLPERTPLMDALRGSNLPLFFDDTAASPVTAGFPEVGVCSLCAVPIRDRSGRLLGAFLMHTVRPHTWTDEEVELVGVVGGTIAALTARLVAEETATQAREGAIRALGLAVDSRDGESEGHTDRVTALALHLAERVGLDGTSRDALRWGAYLHDIGKMGILDTILRKADSLSSEEWEEMRLHTSDGETFALQLPFLSPQTLAVIRHHHERWDGQGYPDGLAGDQIPMVARIFAVCDVYDALRSNRPYKPAWSYEEAIHEISRGAGKQFDPAVVAAFLAYPIRGLYDIPDPHDVRTRPLRAF